MRRTGPWSIIVLLFACAETPQEPPGSGLDPTGDVYRIWGMFAQTNDEAHIRVLDADDQTGGVVDIIRTVGGMVTPPAPADTARAEVFSSAKGTTFWVGVQSPSPWGLMAPDSVIGSEVQLRQAWRFRKTSPDAKFELVISQVHLEVIDHNGTAAQPDQCGWGWNADQTEIVYVCRTLMRANVSARYWAYADTICCPEPFFDTMGAPDIHGWGSQFTPGITTHSRAAKPLFRLDQFEITPPTGADRHVTMRLRSPIRVAIPLDSIAVGELFEVGATVVAKAWSRRQGESYVGAWFRDPVTMGGAELDYDGVTMIAPPSAVREPPLLGVAAPPCGTGTTGAGGTIAFDSATYSWPEWPGDEAEIRVTRTGGSAGEASALFTVTGGTAGVGTDYEAISTHVRFADGETGTRVVHVPIRADSIEEPDETVDMSLSSPGGCASLGRSAAVLTILDDDGPLPDSEFTIGGTVSGLEGTGLVLTNVSTDHLPIDANGAFVFGREYPNGHVYRIRVDTQPDGPAQSCTVANGEGTVASADVTNVEVVCETLSPSDHLDPGFGVGGRVTVPVNRTGTLGEATDVAMQPDGKLVAVGGNRLLRFNADGTPDAGFGTGGEVTVTVHGASYDVLTAVAVQPDGAIVVAGYSKDGVNSPTQEDYIVARFAADGTPDPTFGNGGVVITDFEGRGDAAYDVMVQPDGRIVVTGSASVLDSFGLADSDFAAVRYTADGDLDTSFGNGGRATVNVAGRTDLGYAGALQPDGRVLVAGRVANSGGSDPDFGVARFDSSGVPDPGFGNQGVVRTQTGDWDEAADIVVQPDGRILAVGYTNPPSLGSAVPDTLTIERYNGDGTLDATFGSQGRLLHPAMAFGRAVALQPDGRIVVAGIWLSQSADFGIARFDADGTLDTSFGDAGLVQVDFFGDLDYANAVLVQPDGAIVVAGSVRSGTSDLLGLIRILP